MLPKKGRTNTVSPASPIGNPAAKSLAEVAREFAGQPRSRETTQVDATETLRAIVHGWPKRNIASNRIRDNSFPEPASTNRIEEESTQTRAP